MFKDVEAWKRKKLWYQFETKVAWFGFYKQNNKFGNYNSVLAKLDDEIHNLRKQLYPSKFLDN